MNMLQAIERAKKYNMVWEFVSWYMQYKYGGYSTEDAIYHALYEWDLL